MVKEQQLLLYLFDLLDPEYAVFGDMECLSIDFNGRKLYFALLIGRKDSDYLNKLVKEWCDQKGELKGEQA